MEKDLCSSCQELLAAWSYFLTTEEGYNTQLRDNAIFFLNKIYPQGRSLVGFKKQIREAVDISEVVRICKTAEFSRILITQLRTNGPQSDGAVSKLLGKLMEPVSAPIQNSAPGGLEAIALAGITRTDDYIQLSTVINRLPFSAYTGYFLKGLAGGWENGPHPNTPIPKAAERIISSHEFAALLRFIDGSLTYKEGEAVGLDNLPISKPDPESVKKAVDMLVNYWRISHISQLKKKANRETARKESQAAPKALSDIERNAWAFFGLSSASKDLSEIKRVVEQIMDTAEDTPARMIMRKNLQKQRSATVDSQPGGKEVFKFDVYYGSLITQPVFLGAMTDAYIFLKEEEGVDDHPE